LKTKRKRKEKIFGAQEGGILGRQNEKTVETFNGHSYKVSDYTIDFQDLFFKGKDVRDLIVYY